MILAIETHYRGYRFRSRLEARWAVFFDAMGIEWQYETQGFMLPSGPYLPDFFLPRWELWFEVKGKRADDEELEMCRDLSFKDNGVLLAEGSVGDRPLTLFAHCARPGLCPGSCQCDAWFYKGNRFSEPVVLADEYMEDEGFFYSSEWELIEGVLESEPNYGWQGEGTHRAIRAARSARFEHGENGL